MTNKKVELLSPAGSYNGMTAAFDAGADAVYLGGMKFGARAYANNFDDTELIRAIDYAHLRDRKLYLTVNTLIKEKELRGELLSYLKPLYLAGLDGVIVQDLGIVKYIKETFPLLPIHASTQMTVTGLSGVNFLKNEGINRVVTARELTIKELKYIISNTDVEIEAFIHGAMCYCYSGQCLMSSILGGRSGNRGRCAQPCRLPYTNEYGDKSPLLSLKDMNTYPILGDLVECGIASFKIEGRMKSPEYTAGVTSIYRYQLDLIEDALSNGKPANSVKPDRRDMDSLIRLYSRGNSGTGYYLCQNGPEMLTGAVAGYSSDQNAAQYKIKERSSGDSDKLQIDGKLTLRLNQPSVLDIKYNNINVKVVGDNAVEALNAPISEDDISKRMHKTGNTAYSFRNLDIDMDENIYINIKALNEIRRAALDKLDQEIISSYRRTESDISSNSISNMQAKSCNTVSREDSDNKVKITGALVNTQEQLQAVLGFDKINRIYLERNIWQEYTSINNREIYLCFPHIMRKNTIESLEKEWNTGLKEILNKVNGALIRNLESFEFLKEHDYKGNIITDANLYTWNTEAVDFWLGRGIKETTIPYELNSGEIKGRGTESSEMVVYGYIPLMISAQCIMKNISGCAGGNDGSHNRSSQANLRTNRFNAKGTPLIDHKPMTYHMLKDRYNKVFHVYNRCSECYNIIYNSLPLCLYDDKTRLDKLNIHSIRYQFTIENSQETADILNGYVPENITRGHFNRGVE